MRRRYALLLVLLASPEPASAQDALTGPVALFDLQRYVLARGGEAASSIAFDPASRRVASRGAIRDLCGTLVAPGPDEAPGLAWDPVTGLYWQLTADRVVRRWSGGTLLDTAFVIPATFDVPGAGPDTLESPAGLALDSSFVYVVDRGPLPGDPRSAGWLKLTRQGAPLASSRSTDLNARLAADPDALVSDVTWVPHASPVTPGRLLLALEHSGIVVLDTDGFFVEDFRWSELALPQEALLESFTGIAVDPATGNLYLADDQQLAAQVWTRLPDSVATSYVIGAGDNMLRLHYPNPGCNLPLWRKVSAPDDGPQPWLHGIAFRGSDARIFGLEYSNGELWWANPLSGRGTTPRASGVFDARGVAYDPERNVLYAADAGLQPNTVDIRVVDPLTAIFYVLPGTVGFAVGDIAFSPADAAIYGVETKPPYRLVRIPRDSGEGAAVAPTVAAVGLDYDPASGMLFGMRADGALFRIHPATGAAESVTTVPVKRDLRGLAAIGVPALPIGVDRGPLPAGTWLRVRPNPFRDEVRFELEVPSAGPVELEVFDLAGRRVQRERLEAAVPGRVTFVLQGARLPAGLYLARARGARLEARARLVRLP